MGLFGFSFGQQGAAPQPQPQPQSQDGTPAPVTNPDQNPYTQVYSSLNNPLWRIVGGGANAELRADAQAKAQAWQAQHDYANQTGQFSQAAPLPGATGRLDISDGGAALSPNPVSSSATSSPGPMDAIARAAQTGQPPTGGTSLVNTGAAPQPSPSPSAPPAASASGSVAAPAPYPSMNDLGLPQSRAKVAADALKLGAAGANPNFATANYDWANPASSFDATPRYVQGQNGEWYRIQNGQFTQVQAPDPRFEQYNDAMGYPHMGYVNVPTEDNPNVAATPGAPAIPGQAAAVSARPRSVQIAAPQVSNNEAIQALQVAIAEDPSNPQGILSTIMNRAAASGKSINDVLQEPGQFEVVSNGRAAKIPSSQAIALYQNPAIQSIFKGNIPGQYSGVTSFYAPAAQAALGRPAPKWDDGTGVDVGQTRFFARPFEGQAVPSVPGQDQSGVQAASGPPRTGMPGFQEINIPGQSGENGGALDPVAESSAQSIAAGTMQPLQVGGKNSLRNSLIMARVKEIDPAYDADNYYQRQQTTKNFFNGPAGKQLGSLNTAIEHMGSLADSIDAANNAGAPAWLNGIGNFLTTQLPISDQARQGKLSALDINIQGALHEAMSAYKAAGGSEGEFEGLSKDLSPNASRQAQYAVLQKISDMLNGKRQQLLQQYQTGMGGSVPTPAQLLDPRADQVADRIAAGAAGIPASQGAPGAAAGPPRRGMQAQIASAAPAQSQGSGGWSVRRIN